MARMIRDERVLLARVLKMLPKGIPAAAIESVEYDPWNAVERETPGSYWVYLNDGYICPPMECKTIHEDNLRELAGMVGTVCPWPDDPDLIEHKGYTEYR